ncbi:MAG: FliG C-terminal domain-containing protein [Planctomycetota bacterium]
MSQLHQAAVILHSLPRTQAARILSRLESRDIRTVFKALDRVDEVSAAEILEAFGKFQDASRILAGSEPENSSELDTLEEFPAGDSDQLSEIGLHNRFGFVVEATPSQRLQLLRDEHPRNIATVLAHLPPGISSAIVGQLDTELRISVLRRLCETEVPPDEETTQLVYTLKLRYNKLASQQFNMSGVEVAANLLSCSDPVTKQRLLEEMRSEDPELARRISGTIFEFDDLILLEDSQIKAVLRKTDTSLWAPALKDAPLETRKKILNNMADKAAQVLSEEIANIGIVDPQIAHRARQQVVAQILKMYTRLPEPEAVPITAFPELVL